MFRRMLAALAAMAAFAVAAPALAQRLHFQGSFDLLLGCAGTQFSCDSGAFHQQPVDTPFGFTVLLGFDPNPPVLDRRPNAHVDKSTTSKTWSEPLFAPGFLIDATAQGAETMELTPEQAQTPFTYEELVALFDDFEAAGGSASASIGAVYEIETGGDFRLVAATSISEPPTAAIMLLGVAMLVALRRRRR